MIIFFFKQKTAYEIRISDFSSDVCSSDLQEVTGIVVNRHVNVNSTYRLRLRAMVDRLRSTGSYVRKEPELDGAGSTKLQEKPGTLNQLRSEERRGGKECVGTCRLRRSQYH